MGRLGRSIGTLAAVVGVNVAVEATDLGQTAEAGRRKKPQVEELTIEPLQIEGLMAASPIIKETIIVYSEEDLDQYSTDQFYIEERADDWFVHPLVQVSRTYVYDGRHVVEVNYQNESPLHCGAFFVDSVLSERNVVVLGDAKDELVTSDTTCEDHYAYQEATKVIYGLEDPLEFDYPFLKEEDKNALDQMTREVAANRMVDALSEIQKLDAQITKKGAPLLGEARDGAIKKMIAHAHVFFYLEKRWEIDLRNNQSNMQNYLTSVIEYTPFVNDHETYLYTSFILDKYFDYYFYETLNAEWVKVFFNPGKEVSYEGISPFEANKRNFLESGLKQVLEGDSGGEPIAIFIPRELAQHLHVDGEPAEIVWDQQKDGSPQVGRVGGASIDAAAVASREPKEKKEKPKKPSYSEPTGAQLRFAIGGGWQQDELLAYPGYRPPSNWMIAAEAGWKKGPLNAFVKATLSEGNPYNPSEGVASAAVARPTHLDTVGAGVRYIAGQGRFQPKTTLAMGADLEPHTGAAAFVQAGAGLSVSINPTFAWDVDANASLRVGGVADGFAAIDAVGATTSLVVKVPVGGKEQ